LSSIAKGVGVARPEETRSQPLLGRGMVLLFVALVCLLYGLGYRAGLDDADGCWL